MKIELSNPSRGFISDFHGIILDEMALVRDEMSTKDVTLLAGPAKYLLELQAIADQCVERSRANISVPGSIEIEVSATGNGYLKAPMGTAYLCEMICNKIPHETPDAEIDLLGHQDEIREIGMYPVNLKFSGHEFHIKVWIIPEKS